MPMRGDVISVIRGTVAKLKCKRSHKNSDKVNDTATGRPLRNESPQYRTFLFGSRATRARTRNFSNMKQFRSLCLSLFLPFSLSFPLGSFAETVRYGIKRNRAINALPRGKIRVAEARLELHGDASASENFFNKAREKEIFSIRVLHKLSDALSKFYDPLKRCHRRYTVLSINRFFMRQSKLAVSRFPLSSYVPSCATQNFHSQHLTLRARARVCLKYRSDFRFDNGRALVRL